MTLDKTPQTINKMFNNIAKKYDFINDIMSFGMHKFIKYKCVKNLDIRPHDNVADLCCGTGDIASMIKDIEPDSCVTGIDFSCEMLNIAKAKNSKVKYLQADVTNLPYKDNTFDIITMGFGLRNIQNAEKAVEEVYRTLKPGGKFLHIDFGEKNLINKFYDKLTPILVSKFTDYKDAYDYLVKSRQVFPTPKELVKDFESKGFKLKKRCSFFGVISCQIMTK